MSEIEPITREEVLLDSVANGTPSNLTPITRQEMYLSAIAGETELPSDMTPITREEIYYQKILDNGGAGGGGEATGTKTINITANGTTSHNVKAYATAEIITNVPNSYSSSDEGKVVSNGALASQTSRQITSNGTVDTTLNDEVVVNVPTGITPSGSQTFTQNGTYDVTNLAEAVVDVPVGEEYFMSSVTGAYYPKVIDHTVSPGVVGNYGSNRWSFCTELEEATIRGLSAITGGANGDIVQSCTKLKKLSLPNLQSNSSYIAQYCTALEQIQLGSVDNGVSSIYSRAFRGSTNVDLVITIYVADDTTIPLSGSPWGATNATIVYRSSTTGEVRTV